MKYDEQLIFLLRRMPEVVKYVRNTYRWLDAPMFKDFDEFINRVIFSSVRDFVSDELTNVSYENYERLKNKFYPIIKKIVESELMDEIKQHYNREKGIEENISRIKQVMRITESYNPYIKSEMDEIERAAQDLSRDENLDISVKELVKKFNNSQPQVLSDKVWQKLENTESDKIKKGDMESVEQLAKKYNKTSPKKLEKSLKTGEYEPPLIIKFGNRYHLVAGNTRLCTAAALGINPKVIMVKI